MDFVWRNVALRILDERLAADPNAVHWQFERACLLNEMGKTIEAKDAYLAILAREPSHRGTLNNLGTLLYETGYRSAAKIAYEEAVARHPQDPMGYVNLANVLFSNGDFAVAREYYETALQLDPGHIQAHQGLSYVMMEFGEEQKAECHRKKGFQDHSIVALPYHGEGQPISILLLMSAAGGNTPTISLLDNRTFQMFVVFVEFVHKNTVLPPHQVVFNAVSDVDLVAPVLASVANLLRLTTAPVINLPSAIQGTGRVDIAKRFSDIPGIVAPRTVVVPRKLLEACNALPTLRDCGFAFPILLRTPGFHTGRNFLKVEHPYHLSAALKELPGRDLLVIQYLESRGLDGKFRKYRVMMINGQLYPLHLAVAKDWNVHYFTAEMSDCLEHRAEEAKFLENMSMVLGSRAMASLKQIQNTLGLDYAGVDFGLSISGDLLLFEANATMVVNPPEQDECWNYRRKPVELIFKAIRNMLVEKAKNLGSTDEG